MPTGEPTLEPTLANYEAKISRDMDAEKNGLHGLVLVLLVLGVMVMLMVMLIVIHCLMQKCKKRRRSSMFVRPNIRQSEQWIPKGQCVQIDDDDDVDLDEDFPESDSPSTGSPPRQQPERLDPKFPTFTDDGLASAPSEDVRQAADEWPNPAFRHSLDPAPDVDFIRGPTLITLSEHHSYI